MLDITIFTTETCPRCKALAAKLREWGYQPVEKMMTETPVDEIADCRMDIGYWPMMAPVLRVNDCWYSDISLFKENALKRKAPTGDPGTMEELITRIRIEGWHMVLDYMPTLDVFVCEL